VVFSRPLLAFSHGENLVWRTLFKDGTHGNFMPDWQTALPGLTLCQNETTHGQIFLGLLW
jgi:hypothetical protein